MHNYNEGEKFETHVNEVVVADQEKKPCSTLPVKKKLNVEALNLRSLGIRYFSAFAVLLSSFVTFQLSVPILATKSRFEMGKDFFTIVYTLPLYLCTIETDIYELSKSAVIPHELKTITCFRQAGMKSEDSQHFVMIQIFTNLFSGEIWFSVRTFVGNTLKTLDFG